jgi:hypothetical protein
MNRRSFLGTLAAIRAARSIAEPLPPVRAITRGARFH